MKCINSRKNKSHLKKQFIIGIPIVTLLFSLIIINDGCTKNNSKESAALPAYILEQRTFNSVDAAQKYVKGIPVISPVSIPEGFKLSKIMYTKNKDSSTEISFTYEDKKFNELDIDYTLNEDLNEQYKLQHLNIDFLKVDTSVGYSQPKGVTVTKKNHQSPLTQKTIRTCIGKYLIGASISYNSKTPDEDRTGDNELASIMEEYLNSELINSDNINAENKYTLYSSFDDLMKALPQGVNIIKPNYIPEGFKLENIKYIMVNPNTNFFIIDAAYKNSNNARIIFDYELSGKTFIKINNNEVQTNTAYIINTDENKKITLLPFMEKSISYRNNCFDLNIYMQYDKNDEKNNTLNDVSNTELQKILQSIKNK